MSSTTKTRSGLSSVPSEEIKSPRELERKLLSRVRDPMTAARAELEVLQSELEEANVPAEARDRLDSAISTLRTLERFLEERLILRRLRRGQVDLDLQSVDLLRVLRELARQVASTCRREGKPLCVEAQETALVMADADLLQRLLETLVTCSLTHSLPRRTVIVDIESAEESISVHFLVQGCDAEKKDCPCEKHLENGREERLAFARKVAEAHGGLIMVGPAAGGLGVVFSVTLPKAKPARDVPFLATTELKIIDDE